MSNEPADETIPSWLKEHFDKLREVGRAPAGRCATCGLYAVEIEDNQRGRRVEELRRPDRFMGHLPGAKLVAKTEPMASAGQMVMGSRPFCMAGHSIDNWIQERYGQWGPNPNNSFSQALREITLEDRHCSDWEEYRENRTPEWHWDHQVARLAEHSRRTFDRFWNVVAIAIGTIVAIIAIFAAVKLATPDPQRVIIVTPTVAVSPVPSPSP